jgi:hypothetical protein
MGTRKTNSHREKKGAIGVIDGEPRHSLKRPRKTSYK